MHPVDPLGRQPVSGVRVPGRLRQKGVHDRDLQKAGRLTDHLD